MPTAEIALFAQNAGAEQIGFAIGFIFGFLIVFAVAFIIGLLLGAVLLRLATRIVCGFQLPFGSAVLYTFLVGIINCGVGFVLSAASFFVVGPDVAVQGSPSSILVQGVSTIVGFFLASFLYGTFIKDMYRRPIGFGKGLLITLMIYAIVIGIVICAVILIAISAFAIALATGATA